MNLLHIYVPRSLTSKVKLYGHLIAAFIQMLRVTRKWLALVIKFVFLDSGCALFPGFIESVL